MSVVVCTTPRTGGTWLASLLGFGLPCELLRPSARRRLRHLGYPHGKPEAIRRHAATHGIKVHWDQLRANARWLPRLEDALPDEPTYVLLTRDDRDAQARSMLTAERTGDWFTPFRPYADDLDAAAVEQRVQLIVEHEAGWRGWFADRGITPVEITYERLLAGERL